MFYKIFGGLIMIIAAAFAYIIFTDPSLSTSETGKKSFFSFKKEKCVQLTPAEQLINLVDEDFRQLEKDKNLPAQWKSIATVEVRNDSQLARALLGRRQFKVQRIKNGASYLELQVMDLPDDNNPGIIIQASLFDIKSRNKIFEIGRTYTMQDLNDEADAPAAPAATPSPSAPPKSAPTTNPARK